MWIKWSIGNKYCNHPKWYNFSVALSISTVHIRLPYCFSKNGTFFLEDFRCFLWSLLIFNWLLIFETCCEFLRLPRFAGKNTFCCSSSCSPKSNIFVLVRFWSRIVSLTICFFLIGLFVEDTVYSYYVLKKLLEFSFFSVFSRPPFLSLQSELQSKQIVWSGGDGILCIKDFGWKLQCSDDFFGPFGKFSFVIKGHQYQSYKIFWRF